MESTYQALIIGSGFGGAVAACRLTQAGLRTRLLERGRRYGLGEFPRDVQSFGQRVLWSVGHGLFDVRLWSQMSVVLGAGYGGGSLIYANVHVRPPRDAFGQQWPQGYSRGALDPYYDLVAHMMDIQPIRAQQPLGLPARSPYLWTAARDMQRLDQFRHLNLAVNFGAPHKLQRNRFGALQSGCTHCGQCCVGCNEGAKNTLDRNYLAQAEQQGLEVSTLCEVFKISRRGGGYRVHFYDHAAGGHEDFCDADNVFVCAGSLNTTELLLRCRDVHRTLPELSPALGHRYSGNGDAMAFAFRTEARYEPARGPTITSATVYDRQEGHQRTWFVLEDGGMPWDTGTLLQLTLSPRWHEWQTALGTVVSHYATRLPAWLMRRLYMRPATERTAVLLAMGRDRADGHLSLSRWTRKLRIRWDTAGHLPLYRTQERVFKDMLRSLGGRLVHQPMWTYWVKPVSVHNLGGCVMADSDQRGVVNGHGEVFGHPGLFVLDGAALPTATGVNPSHTIAAVAERNIETFIRRTLKNPAWQAPERAVAPVVAEPLDTVRLPRTGALPPQTPAPVVRFVETMRGFAAAGPVDYVVNSRRGAKLNQAVAFTLEVTVPDYDGYAAYHAHHGHARGVVHVPGLTPSAGAHVQEGTFELFAPGASPKRRRMLYRLPFVDVQGRACVLEGFKDVQHDGFLNVWQATSTLYFSVRVQDAQAALLSGVLRLTPVDFLHQLTTLRVQGQPSRFEQARTMGHFGAMFVRTLAKVFT